MTPAETALAIIGGIATATTLLVLVAAFASYIRHGHPDCMIPGCGNRRMPGWRVCLVCRNRKTLSTEQLESLRHAS